jgi:arabinofuranan 3-O-arabinosyltransferase
VDLRGAARGRLLVVDESFASGWTLDGARPSAHVLANGYANAWVLDTTKPSTVTARFGPSRYAGIAIVVSILAAIVALAVALLLRRRSRRAAMIPDL